MDEELELYLAQRRALLQSDDADLASLKRHDRQLLAAMEEGRLCSPMTHRDGADDALLQALEGDFNTAVLILEARARLWLGELERVQALLIAQAGTHDQAAWWLAAHYPKLVCPGAFPVEGRSEFWATQALWRRGREMSVPEPWRGWIRGVSGKGELLPVVQVLWETADSGAWEPWLAPLLAAADQDDAAQAVNWLASRLDDRSLVRVMGLSCQSRFLPWLASMRHDSELAEAALREVRWLGGDCKQRHEGRQCWGEPLSLEIWPSLFRRLPLGFRDRLWHWCGGWTRGAASSLQGGSWCAGN